MRTPNADLLTAQTSGYPTGGHQPAVRCILTSKDGGTTYDYSFDPTVNTNRLQHAQQIEENESDSGTLLLSNYDRTIPANLVGYYVDIGWGLNTSAGIKWASADGAVAPRLWVLGQQDISGAPKGQQPQLYTVLLLRGVWQAVLNVQPIRFGASLEIPYHWEDGIDDITELADKTVYGCLEYLIETSLSAQTSLTFTLEALGTQDDGLISTLVPFPTGSLSLIAPSGTEITPFGTYGDFIRALLSLTNCKLRPRAGLAFKVVYPQSSDAVDETYYSSMASGHPFYEVLDIRVGSQSNGGALPNHIEVLGDDPATIIGNWYDPDHYTGTTYDGEFMEVLESRHEPSITTVGEADDYAEALGKQMKAQVLGSRVLIPMDARVEVWDRVEVDDQRGH